MLGIKQTTTQGNAVAECLYCLYRWQGLIVRLGKFILPKDGGYMQEMRSS